MAKPPKLSGSELLAELTGGALDRMPVPTPAPTPSAPAQTGRPAKVQGKVVPLTLRLPEGHVDALRLAALAKAQAAGGRVMVTPQDIVRAMIDRAIADPTFPANVLDGSHQS